MAFSLPHKMSLAFLEFSEETQSFTQEVDYLIEDSVKPTPRLELNEVHFSQEVNKELTTLIPFLGDKFNSKVAMMVNNHPVSAVIDTGCRSSVITTSLVEKIFPKWKEKVKKDKICFEGPSGKTLQNKGYIQLSALLGGRQFKLRVNVIVGNKDSLLLGCPALHKLGAYPKPGVGLILSAQRPGPDTLVGAQVNNINLPDPGHLISSPSDSGQGDSGQRTDNGQGDSGQGIDTGQGTNTDIDAEVERPRLQPLAFRIFPIKPVAIGPFKKDFVIMKPEKNVSWSQHNFQKFLVRPCDCILRQKDGVECSTCLHAGGASPYQLSRLENGEFRLYVMNTSPSLMEITDKNIFTAEFQSMVMSCSELAQELLEQIEQEPPVCPYTQDELKSNFNKSMDEFKCQLQQVVCEPGGFEEGWREPILKVLPPRPETYLDDSLTIKDYVNSNPCKYCKPLGLQLCNPALAPECLTACLYPPMLPAEGVVNVIQHDRPFDYNRDINGVFVICKRNGMLALDCFLKNRFIGYTEDCQIIQDNQGGVMGVQSNFHDHPVTHDSTLFLLSVANKYGAGKIDLHFPNFGDFSISKHRLKRIFNKFPAALHLYGGDKALYEIIKKVGGTGARQYVLPPQMPPKPQTQEVSPGLPSPISGGGQDTTQGKQGEASILCNSEEIKLKTEQLLDSHEKLWAKSPWDTGCFRDKYTKKPVYFQLKLRDFTPVMQSQRFLPPARQLAVKELISGMLQANFIKPAFCRFSQNSVYTKKKIEKISLSEWTKLGLPASDYKPNMPHPFKKEQLRHTLDFSTLNHQLLDLPMQSCDPKVIISSLSDNNLISTIDLANSYTSLLLTDLSSQYCGFTSGIRGHPQFTYKRGVQGCKQSPCWLVQSLLNSLQECLSYTHVLWDDVLVLAQTEEQMLERLATVFECLEQSGFVVRRHKVCMYIGAKCTEVELFGMRVDLVAKTVRPLQGKVQALLERPLPQTVSQMRSWMGVIQWHHSFIPCAASHYTVLHKMTHKNSVFVYNEERLEAIEFFLDALNSPHCFTHLPRGDMEFFIFSDASDYNAGFCLLQCEPPVTQPQEDVGVVPREPLQDGDDLPGTGGLLAPATQPSTQKQPSAIIPGKPRVISYQNRVFSAQQIRLNIFEKECLSSLMAVNCFYHFIEGKPTTLFTDSKNNAYLNIFSKTNSKIGRYKLFLESLHFLKIRWVSAKDDGLKISDMLSRLHFTPQTIKNENISKKDLESVKNITRKLQNDHNYLISEANYLMDYLLGMEDDARCSLPDNSLYMDANGAIKVDVNGDGANIHLIDDYERNYCMSKADEKLGEPGVDDQVGGISDTCQPLEGSRPQPLSQDNLGGATVTHLDTGEHTLRHTTHQVFLLKEPGVEFCNTITDVLDGDSLSPQALQDVYFESSQELSLPLYQDKVDDKNMTRADKFLYCVQQDSPHLSFSSLAAAQREDPHLSKHIIRCTESGAKKYSLDRRIHYFLGGSYDILCREVFDNNLEVSRLQVCLPLLISYDFAITVHRATRGPAIQCNGLAPHYSVAKLSKIISNKFYIRKLTDILQSISKSCQICLEAKPKRRNRPNYVRKTLQVRRPAQGWYLDYLKVSTVKSDWGYNELLVFADTFSHFLVAAPVLKAMTQAYFIELLHSHVIQLWGKPQFLYSDTASNLSGQLVRDVCTALNISHNVLNKFTPRSSTAEALNRQLLAALRVRKEAYTMSPEGWCYLLSYAVVNINYSPYKDSRLGYLSPAIKFFGSDTLSQNPNYFTDFMSEVTLLYRNPDQLLIDTKKAQDLISELKRSHLEQKYRESPGNSEHQSAQPELIPGDVVTVRYRPRPTINKAFKLCRRYKYQFVVVLCKGTSVWVRPYNLGSIERWSRAVQMNRRSKETNMVLPVFKIDLVDVEKVRHGIHLYNSNRRAFHYSEHSVSAPQRTDFDILTPVNDFPSLFSEESDADTYSDYPSQEDACGESQEETQEYVDTLHTPDVYFYDENDILQNRLDEKQRLPRLAPKEQTKRIKVTIPDPEAIIADVSRIKDVGAVRPVLRVGEPEAPAILKTKTLSERLANLAGYSLSQCQTLMVKERPRVTFNSKVQCWWPGGRGEQPLSDDGSQLARAIGPTTRPINDTGSVIMNHFDNVFLDHTLLGSKNVGFCSCQHCLQVDSSSACAAIPCSLCVIHKPILWD